MYKLEEIRDVHLEITSKCQARCPMCPRRINGGQLNPLITLDEITLTQFRKWFSAQFIRQLDSLFMCGNLGDPIIAQDCLEIYSYLRESNPNIRLSMHTNGSARSQTFWKQLADLKVKVTFGIDGLSDTHSVYRVDTDFNKIIENAKTFINHGGFAEWHMLVFKHNEHQVAECQQLSEQLKFSKFIKKHTSRFKDNRFHVLDEEGKTVNILYPTKTSVSLTNRLVSATTSKISCKAQKYKQLYISSNGVVSPCCWLDFSWQLPNQDNRVDYMDAVGLFPNLHKNTLEEIFKSNYFKIIEDTWSVQPLMECSKQCGSVDKLGVQFEDRS